MAGDNFELLPDSQDPTEVSCCRNIHRIFTTHPVLYGFMFIGIWTLDLAEMANDWLLLKDILYLDQGLVYGPLSPVLVLVLFISSGVGTIMIIFELANIWRDVCTGHPWVDLDLISCLVIWFEDIPTMSANFAISMCHNEPVSYSQLVKALLVVISVMLRIANPLIRAYIASKDSVDGQMVTEFRKTAYKTMTTIGLCLSLSSAIAVFIFTHVIAADERKLEFRLPQEIWNGKFAHDKYFTDVGVYFHHNAIEETATKEYWLKLANIGDFYGDDDVIHVKLRYVRRGKYIQRFLINSYNSTQERYRECYIAQTENGIFDYIFTNCSRDFITDSPNVERLVFKFVYLPPQKTLILGDIQFNIKYYKESTCYGLLGNDTNILETSDDNEQTVFGRLLYLKQETNIETNHRLVQRNVTTNRNTGQGSVTVESNFLAADDIWKTGMYGCECNGQKGPTFKDTITLNC